MGCADSREQVVLLYPVIIRCRLSGQVQVVQIQIHKIIPPVRMKVYQETAMTLGRTRRKVMFPLKLGMAAAVLMPDLDPGKAEKAMREAAASAEIAAEIAAKAMTRTGEALAAEAAVETAAETAAEVIAEEAAEVIAVAIAVERPAVITEAAEMTKMKDRFRIFV